MAKSRKVEARDRARAAKARVDARRAAREEQISQVQTRYFIALAEREDAQAAAEKAERDMAAAVAELGDRLGVRVEEIAELCEMTQSDARAMKRRGSANAAPAAPETNVVETVA